MDHRSLEVKKLEVKRQAQLQGLLAPGWTVEAMNLHVAADDQIFWYEARLLCGRGGEATRSFRYETDRFLGKAGAWKALRSRIFGQVLDRRSAGVVKREEPSWIAPPN